LLRESTFACFEALYHGKKEKLNTAISHCLNIIRLSSIFVRGIDLIWYHAFQRLNLWIVKQRRKIASFANKKRPNLPEVIFILLFLKSLLSHLTGKIDAESGKS
jgi:hypothetical protein